MDQKKYNRATNICLFSAVGAVLLFGNDEGLRWIALAIAGTAAVVASSLYFYWHLRHPSEADSSHRDGELQQAVSWRDESPDEDSTATANLQITKQHYQALNLLSISRTDILSLYESEHEPARTWFMDAEHTDKSLFLNHLLATHHAYLAEFDSYVRHSKSTANYLLGSLVPSPAEPHVRSPVIVKSKRSNHKPRTSGRAPWYGSISEEREGKGLVSLP